MKFVDVTLENPMIVSIIKETSNGEVEYVKVLANEDTTMICGLGERYKHISFSNPERRIKESEIEYAIKRVMRVNTSNVRRNLSPTGVLHLYWEKSRTVMH